MEDRVRFVGTEVQVESTCGVTRAVAVWACVSCANNHLEIP